MSAIWQHPVATFFLTVGLGFLLARAHVRHVGLGTAAVLFAGLGLGAWSKGAIALPEILGQLGLVLFVYAIGLQGGPVFFPVLEKRGFSLIALATSASGLAALAAWLAGRLLGLDPALVVGLFCGGLTNTPALAAVTETLRGTAAAANPAIGYSISYPLGVLLPILLAEGFAAARGLDVAGEVRRAEQSSEVGPEHAAARNVRLESSYLAGKTIGDLPLEDLGIVVSRIQHGDEIVLATPDTVLSPGDVLHLVGSRDHLDKAERILGPEVGGSTGPEMRRDKVDVRKVFLSNPEFIGKALGRLPVKHQAIIARIRRGDVEFVPNSRTVLERGDILRIVARADELDAVASEFGDSMRSLSDVDFLALSLGVLLGVLVGQVHIRFGTVGVELGLASGPLLVALVLGFVGHSGPFTWTLPPAASQMLRELGLVMFFAAVGLKAGAHFGGAIAAQGPQLLAVGAAITLVSATVLLVGTRAFLRSDWASTLGILGGGQTQPAILKFAVERTRSDLVNTAYVAIMPLAMVVKIVTAQLLLRWLQ